MSSRVEPIDVNFEEVRSAKRCAAQPQRWIDRDGAADLVGVIITIASFTALILLF
jgi:hypothetical protein